MNDSIYNNAGMPSEQGAAPETGLSDHALNCAAWKDRNGHEVYGDDCTCGLRFRVEISTLQSLKNAWEKRAYEAEASVAALTLERDTLKAEIGEGNTIYEAVCAKFDGCPHAQQVNGICGCSFDDKDDVCALHAPQLKKALEEAATLKAKVERLSAPVSDAEWLLLKIFADDGLSESHREHIGTLIAARASTPPPHPINDDEQRRKDAAWNDRPKARCVCGEMIAWYSGEWLHVAGRSKSCADGRLASPAHFLVGMPPAEPEWQKES